MENGRHPSSRGKRRCKRRLRPQGLGISKLGHGRRRGRPDWRRCRAEVGRQHLYVALTGPWASRVLIVRKLKGPSSQASLGAGTAAARINIAPLGVLFGAALDAPRLSPHLLRNRPHDVRGGLASRLVTALSLTNPHIASHRFIAQTGQGASIPTPCTAPQSRRSWRQHAATSRFCGD